MHSCIRAGVLIYGHFAQHYHKTVLKGRLRRDSGIFGSHGLRWKSKTHKHTHIRMSRRNTHTTQTWGFSVSVRGGASSYIGYRSSGVNIRAKLTFSSRLNILYTHTTATTWWIIQIRILGVLAVTVRVACSII